MDFAIGEGRFGAPVATDFNLWLQKKGSLSAPFFLESNLMLMNEIFDSTVQVDWSQSDESTAVGKFAVDDEDYKIRIEAGTYEFKEKQYKIANIGFLKSNGEMYDTS